MRTTTPDKYDDNKSKHSIVLIIPTNKQTNKPITYKRKKRTFFKQGNFFTLHFVASFRVNISNYDTISSNYIFHVINFVAYVSMYFAFMYANTMLPLVSFVSFVIL